MLSPLIYADDISIHLKWYHKFQFAGYYAAHTQGYFTDEGLNVTLIEGGPDKNHLHQLINQSSEYAVAGTETLNSFALGSPIIIVSSIFQHAPEVLITLKKNNVKSLEDLKGKVLMLADSNISGHINSMLEKNGLNHGDYQRHDYDGDINKLIDGTVFAIYGYISNEPYQFIQKGYEVSTFAPHKYDIDFYGDNLVTSNNELEEHPDRVAAVRRAVVRGWNYALEHPDEIINYILVQPTENPNPFNYAHQKFEAKITAELIDINTVPLGHTSPDRWAAMIDTFNKTTGGNAIFQKSYIFSEFHNDKKWLSYLFVAAFGALFLILALYTWNRLLTRRLNIAINGLEKAAYEDNLTGMKNRSSLMLFIEECRIKHHENYYIAIVDICGLQKINREKGFRKADKLIIHVSKMISKLAIENSRVFSLYGGRFAVIAPSDNYSIFESEVNKVIHQTVSDDDRLIIRSGAVKLDFNWDNSSLTTQAELALQHAKENNSSELIFYDKSISQALEQKEALLAEVVKGVGRQEFIIYYQPKLNYQTGKIQGLEALVRWDHPSKGVLGPGAFLPLVEASPEIMLMLENSIIDSVLAQANTLIDYFSQNSDFRISINLSSLQFGKKHLVEDLLASCQKYSVETKYIEFELTESSMLEDLATAITISEHLQSSGFNVALDDFGTGYSSLSYIQNLPVNVIKLDYSFVKNIPKDIRSGYVIEHIISLAHRLDLEVVAEGVEFEPQLHYLGDLKVDIIQGFYFYKPMPISEILQMAKHVEGYK